VARDGGYGDLLVLGVDGEGLVRARKIVVERADRDLHRLERVRVGMVEEGVGAALELVGCGRPGAPAAPDGRADERQGECDTPRRRDHAVGLGRQGLDGRAAQGGQQATGGGVWQQVDAAHLGVHGAQHRLVARRVQHPSMRAGRGERLRCGHRPDVVDDQQAPALAQRLAQEAQPLPGRSQVVARGADSPQQLDLQRDEIGTLTDRHPEHAVGKVPAHRVLARQRRRQHRLADPALTVQSERRTGDPDRTVDTSQHGLAQPLELVARDEAGRQRRYPVQLAAPLARDDDRHRTPGALTADATIAQPPRGWPVVARGQQLEQSPAYPDDLAVRIGRALHGAVPPRVVCPLHLLERRDLVPQARPQKCTHELRSPLAQRRELLQHDEVRRQERRAHQQQPRMRPLDGRGQLRAPVLADHGALVAPDVQPPLAHERREHLHELAPPLDVLAAIADEHDRRVA
jgi:hypothetical protein